MLSHISYLTLVVLLLVISVAVEVLLPEFSWAFRAQILLVPIVFFAAAVTVPYPLMLILAVAGGFFWDGFNLPVQAASQTLLGMQELEPAGDLGFGSRMAFFGLFGSLMQGVRPFFSRGRWELPILMVGVATLLLLVFEFLLLNFRRGGFAFPTELWYRMGTTALMSVLVSPIVFFVLYFLAAKCRYPLRHKEAYSVNLS